MYTKDKKNMVSIRLSDEIYKQLEDMGKERHQTTSQVIRYILEWYVSQRQK